jgi:hypothetical protein
VLLQHIVHGALPTRANVFGGVTPFSLAAADEPAADADKEGQGFVNRGWQQCAPRHVRDISWTAAAAAARSAGSQHDAQQQWGIQCGRAANHQPSQWYVEELDPCSSADGKLRPGKGAKPAAQVICSVCCDSGIDSSSSGSGMCNGELRLCGALLSMLWPVVGEVVDLKYVFSS